MIKITCHRCGAQYGAISTALAICPNPVCEEFEASLKEESRRAVENLKKAPEGELPGWASERLVFHKMEDGRWKCDETGEIQTQEDWDRLKGTWCKFSKPK